MCNGQECKEVENNQGLHCLALGLLSAYSTSRRQPFIFNRLMTVPYLSTTEHELYRVEDLDSRPKSAE